MTHKKSGPSAEERWGLNSTRCPQPNELKKDTQTTGSAQESDAAPADALTTVELLGHSIGVLERFIDAAPPGAFRSCYARDIIADGRWALAREMRQPTDIVPKFWRTPEASLGEIFRELDLLCMMLIRHLGKRNCWPFSKGRKLAIALLQVSRKRFNKISKPPRRVK
jgi:hypothetical protein